MKRKSFNKEVIKYVDMDYLILTDILSKLPKTDSDKIDEEIDKIIDIRYEEQERISDGIRFLCEHQGLSHEETVSCLDEMECDYDISDVDYVADLFGETKGGTMDETIKRCPLYFGVSVIANVRDSEYALDLIRSKYLKEDGRLSLYHYIRVIDEDPDYKMRAIKRFQKIKKM